MHHCKIRRVLPNAATSGGYYYTCTRCPKIGLVVSTEEVALELVKAHQTGERHKAEILDWKRTRLVPPKWVVSPQGVLHALIAARHVQKETDTWRIMCGGEIRRPGGTSKSICHRCITKYNRWLLFISQIQPSQLHTKLQLQLANKTLLEQQLRANEFKAVLSANRLIHVTASLQNEVNALREYISFAVNKLYAEHGILPPPREV
jgi:hypothetical protein